MADEQDGQANGANGAGAPTRMSRDAADKAARDAFMAASEVDDAFVKPDAKKPAPAAAKPAPAPEKPKAAPAPASDDDDEDDELDIDDLEDDDDDEDEVDDDERAADGRPEGGGRDTKDRLAKVRRTEQRAREQIATERREFESQKQAFVAEWKPKIEAAQEFERLKARAKADPWAAMQALGIGEDELEELSQILYGMSKAGAKDPKYRAAAQQLRQNRELREELRATQERVRQFEERSAQTAAKREETAARDRFLDRCQKHATDETPLLKRELEKRPAYTREALRKVAAKLADRDGETPDPKTVARTYEKLRRKAIERDMPLAELLKPAAGASSAGAGKPAAKKPETPIKVEDRSKPEPAAAKRNGKSSVPSRADAIESVERFLRGEETLD